MSFTKGSRKKTILTIIIAAVLISAAIAGGKWGVGFADTTIPTIPIVNTITPNVVPVNAETHTYVLTGTDFISVEYTTVRFIEPNGTIHENIVPDVCL